MSLDTAYRPKTFDDVLGQDSTVSILKQYVKTGAGFHQSYLFSGPWGSGKTTVARIHARALLCSKPVDGAPCDQCTSCKSILLGGNSESFFEVDAATNSGKDSIRKIVEELQYTTFSGKRRIYLMDEAHQLTRDALDALLKPLEDCAPGSPDKLLICIFCTTEPEAMRKTILSRCAPAFVIRPVTPDVLAGRLAYVCDKEGIPYDKDALILIGELTECHFRDALKAIEGVSMLGGVTTANASKYLHLDYSATVLEILSNIKGDLRKSLGAAEGLMKTMSPITVYERLAELSMLAFRAGIGSATVPRYLDAASLTKLGTEISDDLLTFAERFSSRPGKPTPAMVMCDIAQLHRGPRTQIQIVTPPEAKKISPTEKSSGKIGSEPQIVDNVFVHPRAVNNKAQPAPPPSKPELSQGLPPREFFQLVKRRVAELKASEREIDVGPERRDNVGDAGTDESGGSESSRWDSSDSDSE